MHLVCVFHTWLSAWSNIFCTASYKWCKHRMGWWKPAVAYLDVCYCKSRISYQRLKASHKICLCTKTLDIRTAKVCVYFVPEQYENNQKTRGNKSTDKRYILVPWQHRPVGVSLFVCILVKVFACITVKEKHVDKRGCLRQKHFFLTQKTHYCVIFLKLKPLCDQNTKGRGYVALPLCVYPPGARFTSLSLFSCCFCSFSSSSLLCWASHSCFILACRHGKRIHTLFQWIMGGGTLFSL